MATRKKLWSRLIPYSDDVVCVADPVMSDGKLFVSAAYHSYSLALSRQRPQLPWRSDLLTSSMASPVLSDGYLYGTTANGGTTQDPSVDSPEAFRKIACPVQCIKFATGKPMWQKDMPYVSPMVAGGMLIMLEINGILHIGEGTPEGCRDISAADVLAGAKRPRQFATPPVLFGGRIYCRNCAGDLVCIDVST